MFFQITFLNLMNFRHKIKVLFIAVLFLSNCAKIDPITGEKILIETDPKEIDKIEDALAKIINDEVPFYTPWIRQTFNVVSKKLGGTFALYPNDRDSSMGITGWRFK
jgi:cytochrome c556